MPVVCNICGSANRSKAKYCVGCARPLPGFSPSGPGALDAMMAFRPSSEAPERAGAGGGRARSAPALPAAAAFWLKAGCVGLVMLLAFALWCFEVTRKPGAPPLRTELLSMLGPATGPGEAPPMAAAPAAGAPAAAMPPAPRPPVPASETAAASLAAPPQRVAAPPIARTPPRAAPARTASQGGSRSSSSRRERTDASASWAAATEPDLGPPIAIGPGPEYSYPRRAIPAAGSDAALPSGPPPRDLGPPIAPGPGPQYDYSRMPAVRAPSWSSNDPGPPIAAGPGPSVNYLPRGSSAR